MSDHMPTPTHVPLSAPSGRRLPFRLILGAIAVAGVTTALAVAGSAEAAKKQPPPPPPPAASFSITPAPLSFGAVEFGSSSSPQTLTVTNTGSDSQTITAVPYDSGDDDFREPFRGCTDGRAFPITLAAGESCTVSIVFTPSNDGPSQEQFDVIEGNQQIEASTTLSGTGFSSGLFVGSLTPFPATVIGGSTLTGTVNLATTPGGSECVPVSIPVTVVFEPQAWALENGSLVNVLQVPNVVVPAGQCSASFTITTDAVVTATEGGIYAYTGDDPNGYTDAVGVGITVTP